MRTPVIFAGMVFLVGNLSLATYAQAPARADTVPLQTQNNVSNSVSVDSVLLPYKVAKKTFGGEIADNYAVVQITISNHNSDAALIVHSALLDDSHWFFSGNLSGFTSGEAVNVSSYQQQNTAFQVSSAESRVVRGEAQDQQPWTARNIAIRAAITIGTLASGFQFFAGGNTQVLSGIASYNGQAIPAFQLFWPDNTQARLNRISDFGFQTNKVIAKSSSDIIIAFFPIDRFLTNSLKTIYKKDPAAFFNPLQMLLNDKESRQFLPLFKGVGGIAATASNDVIRTTILEAFNHYESATTAEKAAHSGPITVNDAAILGALGKVSLTNIRVIVGGIMTVDTLAVPAVISSVMLEEVIATRSALGTHNASISGSFLEGGKVQFFDTKGVPLTSIDTVTVDDKKSSDKLLKFTYNIPTALAPPDTLAMVKVVKSPNDGSMTSSAPVMVDLNPSFTVDAAPTLTTPASGATAATWAPTLMDLTFTLGGKGLTGATAVCSTDQGAVNTGTVTVASDTSMTVVCHTTSTIPTGTKIILTVKSVIKDGTTATTTSVFPVSYQ